MEGAMRQGRGGFGYFWAPLSEIVFVPSLQHAGRGCGPAYIAAHRCVHVSRTLQRGGFAFYPPFCPTLSHGLHLNPIPSHDLSMARLVAIGHDVCLRARNSGTNHSRGGRYRSTWTLAARRNRAFDMRDAMPTISYLGPPNPFIPSSLPPVSSVAIGFKIKTLNSSAHD